MQINIDDIKIKEVVIAKTDGKITCSVVYTMVDDQGNEVQAKRDLLLEDQISTDCVDWINKIFTEIHDSINSKEEDQFSAKSNKINKIQL